MATPALHPAAPHHIPFFVPGPDGSDPVLVATGIFLIGAVVAFGLIFLRIHTLPERMAHRSHKLQFEIVAVLGLLALFTHMHIFWVAGLLLALIDIPDVTGPMRRIAGSAETLAGLPPGAGDTTGTTRAPTLPHPAPHAEPHAAQVAQAPPLRAHAAERHEA